MNRVLVINVGSSSVKYELFDMDEKRSLLAGAVEAFETSTPRMWQQSRGVGSDIERDTGTLDHAGAVELVFDVLAETGAMRVSDGVDVVAHRVVHGGERFTQATLVDDEFLEELAKLDVLAPLHNPVNRMGIGVARRRLHDVHHVAVFDTAFHRTLPPRAYRYAIPRQWYQAYGMRRFGFHGPSHDYVSRMAADHLGIPLEKTAMVTLHLGNGASAAAVLGGESIDTSMGVTPLEGLVMGTRCGDLDPAMPGILRRTAGIDGDCVEDALQNGSGLLGLCGDGDMREVQRRAALGNDEALLALEVFCYRVKKYIGAYVAAMGRIDALVFTAGIGEHDAGVRERVCRDMEFFGIELDPARNLASDAGVRAIGTDDSRVAVLVVPTDEELEIAAQAAECVRQLSTGSDAGR